MTLSLSLWPCPFKTVTLTLAYILDSKPFVIPENTTDTKYTETSNMDGVST